MLDRETLGRALPWGEFSGNGRTDSHKPDEPPFRSELFTVEQLERYAVTLAESHKLEVSHAPEKLIPRLLDNERVLVQTYDLLTEAVAADRRIAPASEWLLDNFYLIEEQIRTARLHLPRSYGRQLPRLAGEPHAGQPRVYAIALELISHVDGRLDAVSLNSFIASYQTVQPLNLGELWAVPIVLRLALIENLRRIAARIHQLRKDRDSAIAWAERMIGAVEKSPTNLILVMADMARADPPLSGAFLAELTRHLQGQSPYYGLATTWLEQRLAEQGLKIEDLVRADARAQAANQVSIGNSINSLRFLSSTDWRDFVENHSVVEKTLRDDPAGVYAQMDFATRDRYRHGIEEIAKRSDLSEPEVARLAVQLAQRQADHDPNNRRGHIGYFLIDEGRPELERLAKSRQPFGVALRRIAGKSPLFLYLAGIFGFAAAVLAVFIAFSARRADANSIFWLSIPAAMCAVQMGLSIINWISTMIVQPRPLPRLDFRKGIPDRDRTVVVIPTMLTSPAGVEDLLAGLELRYLANRDPNLHFALLTDFKDAPSETMPEDADMVQLAVEGVERLNEEYKSKEGPSEADIFYLFHRPRLWNPAEGVWMGYERKRGKLAEFNAALRGKSRGFSHIVGDVGALQDVQYAITLDTDTQLPRDAAREMVGTLAHPLNRAVYDPKRKRIVEGYGILQPRVGISLPSAGRSWFVKLFAGDIGVDPYTRVVSDVYQDLFCEGS
ncbi:MAG: cyclic beta 1-2 glucan synthetase, partial [Phycisphaerae bacterium]|nr:cyclic beta 1-2 glucan synthetase [Phycisphaerae bacterium]